MMLGFDGDGASAACDAPSGISSRAARAAMENAYFIGGGRGGAVLDMDINRMAAVKPDIFLSVRLAAISSMAW